MRVRDGDVIRVEAVAHHAGDAPDLMMDDDIDAIWAGIDESARGPGVHILTGPIEVEGAEPGDTLVVQILDMTPRLPYGSNCAAHWGLLYDTFGKERITIYGLNETETFGPWARPLFGFDFAARPLYDLPGVISPVGSTARQPCRGDVRVPELGTHLGLRADDAYSLASVAIDLGITQVVDGTVGCHAGFGRSIVGGA